MTLAELIEWAMTLEDKTLLDKPIYLDTVCPDGKVQPAASLYVDNDGDIVITDKEGGESEAAAPSEEAE